MFVLLVGQGDELATYMLHGHTRGYGALFTHERTHVLPPALAFFPSLAPPSSSLAGVVGSGKGFGHMNTRVGNCLGPEYKARP